jgi:ABC-2 type transport system permease protein
VSGDRILRVIRREYVESVRKKSFLFGLVATPAVMALMIFLPFLSGEMLAREEIVLAVVDPSGEYGDRLAATLDDEASRGALSFRPRLIVYGPGEAPPVADLDGRVLAGELSGWIRLPDDFATSGRFEYRSESITNITALEVLEGRFERMVAEKKAADLGIPPDRIESLLAPVEMRTIRLGRDGGEESDFTQIYLKAVALVMIMFFALMPTGQILMRSVIEEKSNRVIEVLISSITPRELMVGKILGLGAVGLTLLGAWAGAAALLALRGGVGGGSLPIGPSEAGFFLMYFFPGYFLYAALLGTIGSICNSEREAQPFLTPISLALVFPVMLGIAIAQSPDHLVARVLSFFPLLTPSLMMFRIAIKEPPVWEVAATWATLLAATVGMFVVAARVFRIGILMYGKRPSLPEVLRWIRAG